MSRFPTSRRQFLKLAGVAGAGLLRPGTVLLGSTIVGGAESQASEPPADYTLRIANTPIELAPNRIVSAITYNGQFPGPLLRFKEGQLAVVDIYNDTDAPEQLHWHGQFLSPDVDGAAEEGTPFIPAHGKRRIAFTPRPAGFRFYHTHNRAGADLHAGQYSGQVGPVYIEPRREPGNYDREVFLVLKEFEPSFSQGGDMAMDFLAPATKVKDLETSGESAMKASLAKGMPHGYEVGYRYFTINGRMSGHGEPVRVKHGERVLFHILNGSATEIRSLALPGHTFRVVALDGNPVPTPAEVPVLWLGTAERISAVVEMNHPGVWLLGDLADDDRAHGMGVVVEYAGHKGKPLWTPPKPFHWNYSRFAKQNAPASEPDELIEMTFAKQNAAEHGFKPMVHQRPGVFRRDDDRRLSSPPGPALSHPYAQRQRRYSSHPSSSSLLRAHQDCRETSCGDSEGCRDGRGYQEVEICFTANNPGITLFHCHQQLHMDFGFMTLFEYL